jgi:ArsR family transcriptional regulator
MDRHWSPGRTWESLARAVAGLVQLGDVVDVGSGDGSVAQLLAPRARSWTCVDRSERVLSAARARLGKLHQVSFVPADAGALPLPDASFDAALLLHVLAQVESPARVLTEVSRVMRPGGLAVVVTLDAHDHAEVTAAYGDLHPGFAPAALRRMLARAGLEVGSCEITSRDVRPPSFRVVTSFATKPSGH